MRFKDLPRGATFDFVDDARPSMNSFYHRCRKIGGRRYEWTHPLTKRRLVSSVGSLYVVVYHVDEKGGE
jgi:hypothetical protein